MNTLKNITYIFYLLRFIIEINRLQAIKFETESVLEDFVTILTAKQQSNEINIIFFESYL